MNIQEAILKSAFIPDSTVRAKLIVRLVEGTADFCDNCGFIVEIGKNCEICENEWADQMAEKEEELNWGRHDMLAGKF